MVKWEPIDVFSDHPYQVLIGHGATALLPDFLAEAQRVAIIFPEALTGLIDYGIGAVNKQVTLLPVPDAEAAKTPEVVAQCWNRLAEEGFTRSDAIVGFGGGATTDLAGFIAATWLRGVRYIAMPSTLLGLVDASVGGKTGINLPSGKNLVGSFYEPYTVLGDLDLLTSLPARELRSGLAEILKVGFISDISILDIFATDTSAALHVTDALEQIIRKAVRVKADVVSKDFYERTATEENVGREALNYGHTLAHAIEKREGFRWRHGEAVAVGMIFAAEVSNRLGYIDSELVNRHREILQLAKLPTTYQGASWDDVRNTMRLDKKVRGSALRMVLLDGLGKVCVVQNPDEQILQDAFESVSN